jgi:hypothetical protein
LPGAIFPVWLPTFRPTATAEAMTDKQLGKAAASLGCLADPRLIG